MCIFDKIKINMGFDVKNTTFFRPLDLVAPFTCRGCGALGEILCECCKNYNISAIPNVCPRCGEERSITKETSQGGSKKGVDGKEKTLQKFCQCEVPIFAVAKREGILVDLVEDYKYKSIRRAAETLAELMDKAIEVENSKQGRKGGGQSFDLDENVVLVPLPTIRKHIRERGFDHTLLLAKKLAKRHKGWRVEKLLERRGNTVQVGTDGEKRQEQAKKAYGVVKSAKIDAEQAYFLVDDVWTTGASMEAAISLLQKAGAKKLAGVVMLIP